MEYLMMLYADESALSTMSDEQGAEMRADYAAYSGALQKAGILRGGNRLRPATTATTVRVQSGKTEVLNGPYADTREQLGGYYLIDVPDLDTALSWAARNPGASHGVIEVRPIWPLA